MNNNDAENKLFSEDWKKEQVKFELEKKHQHAGDLLSFAFRNPVTESIKDAHTAILDYIISIPLLDDDKDSKNKIDGFLTRMDDISDAIYGDNKNQRVVALRNRFGIESTIVKISSVRTSRELVNFRNLLRELRQIHMDAGYFSTSAGLRLTIHRKRKHGMGAIMEEEGFDFGDKEPEEEKDG